MALKNVNAIRPTDLLSKLLLSSSSSSNSIQVIDASWYMPATKINARELYKRKRIPGAKFFDLDDCCDKESTLPHMMPTKDYFLDYLSGIGVPIDPNQDIVVYDTQGMFSSPRLWYMLKVAGFQNVAVLEGGLPGWDSSGFQIDTQSPPSNFLYVSMDIRNYKLLCVRISDLFIIIYLSWLRNRHGYGECPE